jgi:putative membrane protein
MWGGTWLWHLFWMVLILGVMLLIVWTMVRTPRRNGSAAGPGTDMKIARERYARGEITRDEFLQIKRDLEG